MKALIYAYINISTKAETEMDLQVLFRMVKGDASIPWKIKSVAKKMLAISRYKDFHLSHIFGEANVVENSLVTLASATRIHQQFVWSEFPKAYFRISNIR